MKTETETTPAADKAAPPSAPQTPTPETPTPGAGGRYEIDLNTGKRVRITEET
jgi:hypothetical protein